MQRRHFLATTALALPTILTAAPIKAPVAKPKIIGFSKVFIDLDAEKTAELVADVGWDGIDIPIRKGVSHIDPAKVSDDLPKMIEALKKRDKQIFVVTTDITKMGAQEEAFLRILAANGIKKYRLGFVNYKPNDNPMKVVREFAPALKDIAAMNKELGLWSGYQNHSGPTRLGGPVWDILLAMEGTDPAHMGLCFDIAHATVEGGTNWPVQVRAARDRIGALNVKDYRWREAKGEWNRDACPIGDGIVRKKFFTDIIADGCTAPLCQHFEYEIGDAKERIVHFKRDLALLRSWIG